MVIVIGNYNPSTKQIPNLSQNPVFHNRTHKNLSLEPILSQMNPANILTHRVFKNNFNIIICVYVPRIFSAPLMFFE